MNIWMKGMALIKGVEVFKFLLSIVVLLRESAVAHNAGDFGDDDVDDDNYVRPMDGQIVFILFTR